MRTTLQHRASAALLAAWGALMVSGVARPDDTPPKELLQYVQDARQQGVPEAKIREQARGVGWPAAMVDKAIGKPENRGVPDDYQIGPGDTLQISVWKEQEVSVPS